MLGKKKLLILQTHPIQYYAPLYKAITDHGELAVKVIYLTDEGARSYFDPGFGQEVEWDIPLLEGYENIILQPNTGVADKGFWSRHDTNLVNILNRERPDWLLLYGYASQMNWVALHWAVSSGVKVAYTSDTNNRLVRKGFRTIAKIPALRWYFNKTSAFFSPSVANRDYLTRYGANPMRIHWCPFAIDAERFVSASKDYRQFDFLWAGKLISIKRPLDYIQALGVLINRGYTGVRARLIGSGECLPEVRKLSEELVHDGILELAGFVNQARIATELSGCKIFVFTCEAEAYGLAATEAAAAGAALVVADGLGCIGPNSSAQPGKNAITYPVADVGALANAMEHLLVDIPLRSQMQSASKQIGREHDVSNAARIISKVLNSD
ncbi:MAG: glycosyltransferase [Chromatiaceae bacterium]|nr:glycosyltransferase [Chromatiaceae bacterium]